MFRDTAQDEEIRKQSAIYGIADGATTQYTSARYSRIGPRKPVLSSQFFAGTVGAAATPVIAAAFSTTSGAIE